MLVNTGSANTNEVHAENQSKAHQILRVFDKYVLHFFEDQPPYMSSS